MANVKLTFLGTEKSKTQDSELECFAIGNDEIFISLKDDHELFICLDKSTAIRFAKTLRTEINKIQS